MLLSELKSALARLDHVEFQLPDGTSVPEYFHVTEVGSVTKHYIDCVGTVRHENLVSLQLWTANDYDHRLSAQKLRDIIRLSENVLILEDVGIEVEYQGNTICKYGLEFNGSQFVLTQTHTDCLAKDQCGIPVEKPKIRLSQLQKQNRCEPNSGCC